MQTSLDRSEIMQIHQFIDHLKINSLDLQFDLFFIAQKAKINKKTVIFVNILAEI